MRRRLALPVVLAGVLPASAARAHHGMAAVGPAGPEGPGAAIETTSALPLGQGVGFALLKSEVVPYERYRFADPNNRSYALFGTAALGYGVRPWLSLFAFQPLNVKEQDGAGRNTGLGDPNLMLAFAFKYDEGLRLVPERESLDDLMDWHFSLWASSTIPLGPTATKDAHGAYFEPELQIGFGAPSACAGAAVTRQVSSDLTWLADASYLHFFPHAYPFTRYQFGDEVRLDTAAAYRLHGSDRFRIDLVGELQGLHIRRDRERNASGAMAPLRASGGAILYAGAGLRAYAGALSIALGVRRAALRSLHEQAEQQGSEGLELLRAVVTVSYSTRL